MKSPEGKQPSYNRAELVKVWRSIMSPEGILVDLQDKVIEELNAAIENPDFDLDFDDFIAKLEIERTRFEERQKFFVDGLETQVNSYRHTAHAGSLDGIMLFDSSHLLNPHDQRFLQVTAYVADRVFSLLSKYKKTHKGYQSDTSYDHTNLASPFHIIEDNVQTIFDVARTFTRECKSAEEQIQVLTRLSEERPEIIYTNETGRDVNCNPFNESNIEICARAPFSFWAHTRYDTPISFNGEKVSDVAQNRESLISPGFAYLITRYKFDPDLHTEMERHGGCPILYKDVKAFDFANRFTSSVSKAYSKIV